MKLDNIFKKTRDGVILSKEELIYLLEFPSDSIQNYQIMAESRRVSNELSDNKGEVHAQFALNLAPCPKNCKFCAFAYENKVFSKEIKISPELAINYAKQFEEDGANAVFVMTTANYDFNEFIEISKAIRKNLKKDTLMIANLGDISLQEARQLKDTGFHGVYHAMRMGEGTDTQISPENRIESIQNFKEAGLSIGTCVEPVGPEHSNEEIAEKILFTGTFDAAYSGAARRISIPGTELSEYGMISELRMAQIVAVTRLGIPRAIKGLCTHEPCSLGVLAGANLFWAEVGANPRDVKEKTEEGRGMTVSQCREIYTESEWGHYQGSSRYYTK